MNVAADNTTTGITGGKLAAQTGHDKPLWCIMGMVEKVVHFLT